MFTNLLKLLKDMTGKNQKLLLGALAVLILVGLVVLVVTGDLSIALTISLVLAIAGAVWCAASSIWDRWQASSKQRVIFQELGGQRTLLPPDAGVTAGQLHKKFEEALKTLEEKLGKGFLFRLPWFLVLGEPASGKTTSLRYSSIPWRLTDEL